MKETQMTAAKLDRAAGHLAAAIQRAHRNRLLRDLWGAVTAPIQPRRDH